MNFRSLPFVTLVLSSLFTAACGTIAKEPDNTGGGSDRDRTCEAEATLRFENCAATTAQTGQPAIPRIIVASSIKAGANGPEVCAVADQSWLAIGAYGAGGNPPRPVDSGENEAGDRVNVSCVITPDVDGSYRVSAEAFRAGVGTISVGGSFRPENAPQTGISVRFTRFDLGTFTQTDCVARYDVDPAAGIADGRAWFRVSCPRALSPATR
jgi:hypothetical protein